MKAQDALLHLEQVTRSYADPGQAGRFELAPTTLSVEKGSWTAISGRSGTGKTTLINLLAGLDRPDSGRVWMFGRDVTDVPSGALSELRRKRVGIVYQDFFFLEHLSVWQNVSCRLVPAGVSASERRERAEQLLETFGLADAARRRPRELSGGEQQRVALARAVIDNPDVLLADEPTSSVDARTGASIVSFLEILRAQGMTIVAISHDPTLLQPASHRIDMDGPRP
ncbi:MAG: ABC-type lipoprotein export system ATPase subunit [Chlamydiales bacterium]